MKKTFTRKGDKMKMTKVRAKVPYENPIVQEKLSKSDKKETEIIVILDRSGSMRKIAPDMVEGFNTFLNEQKNSEDAGEAFITLVQFDDRYEVDYRSIPVNKAPELILDETYIPRGKTALYESIGKTIQELKTDRDVVFVVITDGQDNVRSEFKVEAIKKMIDSLQEEEGWKFLFLGANQDAFAEGGKLGVKKSQSMSYAASGSGIQSTFHAVSGNLKKYRSSKAGLFSMGNLSDSEVLSRSISSLDFMETQRNEAMDTITKETTKETKETIKETIKKHNNE